MPYRRPIAPVMAGAPPAESIDAALSMLLFLSDPKGQKTAKVTLEALQNAVKENTKVLESFGPANRIAALESEAETDRADAAQVLADAKAEAATIVSNANGKAEGRIAILDTRDADLSNRERALEARTETHDKRVANFARESAGLRAALKI